MMTDSRALVVLRLVGALCVGVLLTPVSTLADDQWPADVQFASQECGNRYGCGDCCDIYCGSGSCGSADCDYGLCGCGPGCCRCREHLLGDMWGVRSGLANGGIVPDLELTQFYQGVTSGGQEQVFEYGGKLDYIFAFDGQKLGMWQGLYMNLHAETRFGEDVNLDAAGLAPANANMLYPANEHVTAITGLLVTQAFSEEWSASAGKYNLLDLLSQLYPEIGRGIDGFMNLSSLFPISVGRPLNLSMMGASVVKMQEGQVQATLGVFDTNNSSTTSGFDDMFDNGAVIVGYGRIFTDFDGLPGSHGLLGIYSSGTYTSVDPLTWGFLPDVGVVPGQETGSWNITYLFDQKLWVDRCNPHRNIGLFTGWGIADGNPSPFNFACNVALQAHGLNSYRPADSMGVAYFHTGLSSDFEQLLSPVLPVHDLNGVEFYYNAAVSPWFHLTGDFQVVEPASIAEDTAIVVGLRANWDL